MTRLFKCAYAWVVSMQFHADMHLLNLHKPQRIWAYEKNACPPGLQIFARVIIYIHLFHVIIKHILFLVVKTEWGCNKKLLKDSEGSK